MSVYIFKNNQQSGPFEENAILVWLKNGQLSIEDLACRTGANEWQKLKALFPAAVSINPPPSTAPVEIVKETPAYRKTMLQKIVFGGIFVLLIFAFVGALLYLKSFTMSSGDLETDLVRMAFRNVAGKAVVMTFIALILGIAAFLLSFKTRIIQSFGLRMLLRCFFSFLIFAALIQISYAVYKYQNYYPPSYKRLLAEDKKISPLEKTIAESEIEAAESSVLATHLPIAFGLFVLGASGFSMTQFKTSDDD